MRQQLNSRCLVAAAILCGVALGAGAEELQSLRGGAPLEGEEVAPAIKNWKPDQAPLPRDYVQQPPLIPHSIEGYRIDQKSNKCLTCHSWANYREAGATKISQTHFSDRDANVLANVAPLRYFCTQCHVAQMDTEPLVENTFEPVKAIQQGLGRGSTTQ